MTKSKLFLFITVFSLLFCQPLISREKLYNDYSEILNKWEKAVIVEGHINALLPYNLANIKKSEIERHQLVMISLKNKLLTTYEKCLKIPVRISEEIDITYTQFNKILENYSNNHPTAWDISSEFNLYFNDLSGVIYNSIKHYKKYYDPQYKHTEYMHSNSHKIHYCKIYNPDYKRVVNKDGKSEYKELPFDPANGLNNAFISNNNDTVDIFMFNQNQVLVWEVDFKKEAVKNDEEWKFKYTFKMPRTSHFEVCRIWDDLYILTNEYGIYKLDIEDAKKNAPEPPNNVFKKYSYHTSLIWDGFQQEHIVENKVKAEKISDLNYDRYIVDKDHNTAYIVSKGYLYELNNLKIRVKIPELQKTENFLDAEAEYMRAVLEAIYNLGKKPENTPAALLKVTPDSEIDKNLTDEKTNANNSNGNANGESDDNEAETDPNKKNGNADNNKASVNSNESANDDINSSDSDSQNPSKNENSDADNQNSSNSNPDPANTSDGSNFALYAGGAIGLLILITLILVILPRKKH